MPEVVTAVLELKVETVVLDGELIALRPDGRPEAFQITGSRTATRAATGPETVPLTRTSSTSCTSTGTICSASTAPSGTSGSATWCPRNAGSHASSPKMQPPARRLHRRGEAGPRGRDGEVPDRAVRSGPRGSGWVKVEQTHTLDLIVLAAEWGHGRRTGWLSNLHLGARDEETGEFVMLGKTFKGLTDELLRWQTEKFQQLETSRDDYTVYLRPEIVVEIAFDGVQTSTRYPGGMALRFARVLRYRDDKTPSQVDTVQAVRAIHQPTEGAGDDE